MPDVHTPEVRSKNMRAIRCRDTKPEIWLRKSLHSLGLRYRVSAKELPGKPDLLFPKFKAVIFVNGCFWHAHNCHYFRLPSTRKDFWAKKLGENVRRDERNIKMLLEKGYRVLIVWECAIKGRHKIKSDQLIAAVSEWIKHSACSGCVDGKGLTDVREIERYFYCCGGKIPHNR